MNTFRIRPFLLIKLSMLLLTLLCSIAAFSQDEATSQNIATLSSATVQQWTLNQQNADIREFIAQVAKITGATFVIDPRIKPGNTVTVLSTKPLTKDEVYDVFLEVLLANGYSALPKGDGNIVSIAPNTAAKSTGVLKTGKEPNGIITTQVIELHSVSAVEVVPIIRPLVAQNGHVAASASSNAIIVSDAAENVARISQLMKELDDAGNNDYDVIKLKHAWVGDVAKIVAETMSSNKSSGQATLQVIADERSNRLVVKGSPAKRLKVKNLVEALDLEGIRKSTTKVMFLSFGDAANIATLLAEASGVIQKNQPTPSEGDAVASLSAPTPTKTPPATKSGAEAKTSRSYSGSNIFIKADATQNALVMIADPSTLQELEQIVHQLDVPRAQVLLEAVIVEVSGGISDALGIQWGIDGTNTGSNPNAKDSVTGHILNNTNIALGSVALRAENFGVLVSALSSSSVNNILSTPSMLTLDNQEAELVIGKNIPIKTGSYQTSSSGNSNNPFTTTERKDVGLRLKVTPHINEGNSLRLMLEQEVSSLDVSTSKQVLGSENNDLLFNTRSLKTAVLVDDGQTVVIGGLIEDIKSKNKKKVPILGSIPLLGRLFTYEQTVNDKKNLMLFIRPTIMRSADSLESATNDRFSKLKLIHHYSNEPMPVSANQLFDIPAADLRGLD